MNNITTCPNCLTRFLVGRSQLKANQGQVKCAKCQHVFDFRKHLESTHEQTVFLGAKRLQSTRKNRRILIVVTIVTLLTLVPMVFFAHTHIAMYWPASQATLIKACELLHCKDPLPKKIQLMRLEGTELIKEESVTEKIKFTALLINNAPYTQAYPELALTLTDSNDQVISSQRIKPEAYAKNVKEGLKAGEELHIHLELPSTEQVASFSAAPVYR